MPNPKGLIQRTPFFYGWVIVGCAMCANFARQGSAVATLSIFAIPMSTAFDWSMTEFSGAVSLGGLLGAVVSPKVGVLGDRRGSGQILVAGTFLIGVSMIALSQTESLIWFYIAFCLGRMAFAGPFEIAITSAIANWFIQLRGRAMSFAALAHSIGLTVLPLVAFSVIDLWDWRIGWLVIAAFVLVVGVTPNYFLVVQRPEDVGLRPYTVSQSTLENTDSDKATNPEVSFTRREAMQTSTFWLLIAFSVFIYPVQAGVSLHQAPHMIDRGLSMGIAASAVSLFSMSAAFGGLLFGQFELRHGARLGLAVAATLIGLGSTVMLFVSDTWTAYLAAVTFGAGIGGLLTILPVAWANNFGRENLGAIRGVTIPVQTLAQASGPLVSGALFDITGSYDASLTLFSMLGFASAILAYLATPTCKSRINAHV